MSHEQIIDKIRLKLLNQEMSVLVGSGFSKNASKDYPLWDDLLKDLVMELFCNEYEDWKTNNPNKKEQEFLKVIFHEYDYLEIVERYIKFKGMREAITFYIEDKFRPLEEDHEKLDLEIHKKLVECPWNNIYTTNYDSLIEIGAKASGMFDYQTIKNSSDLSIRPHRRIIKLHGSLRTQTEVENNIFGFDNDINSQYVISKSDYNRYTQLHSAFTHLMRIALLQESFCLIGFSGSDPNFLGWVNWVRDVLKSSNENKVYFIDVSDKECEREKSLFFNNHKIEFVPLKKIYGDIGKKELIDKFLTEIHTPDKKMTDSNDNQIPTKMRSYFELWNKLEGSELFSVEFIEILKRIEDNESYFKLPSFSVYHSAELILSKIKYKIFKWFERSEISELDFLNFISILQRNSYLNLITMFKKEDLQKLISIFSEIDNHDLSVSDTNKWTSFSLSLLRSYRCSNEFHKFNELKTKIIAVNYSKISILEEVFYEEALLSAINLDLIKLSNLLDKWSITKTSSCWACVRKAFLLNSLKMTKYNDEIVELIRESIKRTQIEQEKLWLYEILSGYRFSVDLVKDDYCASQISNLKAKGLYTIENIVKSLTDKQHESKIKPSEETRYTITHNLFGGSTSNNMDYARFIEFVYKVGFPFIAKIKYNITMFNNTKWFEIFEDLYQYIPKELLFLTLQYSGNDTEENFSRTCIQRIVFSSKISNDVKRDILEKFEQSFLYYLKEFDSYKPVFIFAISELVSCIQYRYWKSFMESLWNLQKEKEVIQNKFYSDVWGLEKAIDKIIPFIKDNKLLNQMLCSFFCYASEDKNNSELTVIKYIELVLRNPSFKAYKVTSQNIEPILKEILQKENLSNNDLFRIYYFNTKISQSLAYDIQMKIINTDFSLDNMIYWELILKLSKHDSSIDNKFRKTFLENDRMLFYNGIDGNGRGRSDGGYYFSVSNTFKNADNKTNLSWTIEHIQKMYFALKASLNKFEEYKKNHKDSNFFFFNDFPLLNDMHQFLVINKRILSANEDYSETLSRVSKHLISELGFENLVTALVSGESNQVHNAISSLSKLYEKYPKDKNAMALVSLLMRILRKDEVKLEMAIISLSNILSNTLKEEEWPKAYQDYYIQILEEYYDNIPENLNRIFIEKHLIKLAKALRANWKIKNPIISKWLKHPKTSEFIEINRIKLR